MAYTPVTQSQLPTLIRNFRNHPIYGPELKGMDDWQVYQEIKNRYQGFDLAEAPEEWRQNHVRQLIDDDENLHERPGLAGMNQANMVPGEDDKDSLGNLVGIVEPLLDSVPSWLGREAIQYGLNNSFSGLATHILSGEAPFELQEGWEPNILENAIGFAAGMAADFYLFSNPVTAGPGLAFKAASGPARKEAAKVLSKYIFGRNLTGQLTKEGAKEGFEGLTKGGIQKAFKKGGTTAEAKDYLLNKTTLEGGAKFEAIYDASFDAAEKVVAREMSSKRWMHEGLKITDDMVPYVGLKAGEQLLPKPTLRRIMLTMGTQSAKALGMYGALTTTESQIVEGIRQRYGEDAPNIYNRWKETGAGEDLIAPLDPSQILYSTMHGYLGGFVAGGLSGIRAMGMAGALTSKAKADKWLTNEAQGVKNKLYEGWKADVGWITSEGLGFTLAGRVTDSGARALGMDLPEHSFGEDLLQNIATIGTMKVVHKAWRQGHEKLKRPMGEINSYLDRKIIKQNLEKEKIERQINKDDPANKALLEGIAEKYNNQKEIILADKEKLFEAQGVIKKVSGKKLEDTSEKDFAKLKRAEKAIKEVTEKYGENPDFRYGLVEEVVKDLDGLKNRILAKDIKAFLKRKEKLAEAEKSQAEKMKEVTETFKDREVEVKEKEKVDTKDPDIVKEPSYVAPDMQTQLDRIEARQIKDIEARKKKDKETVLTDREIANKMEAFSANESVDPVERGKITDIILEVDRVGSKSGNLNNTQRNENKNIAFELLEWARSNDYPGKSKPLNWGNRKSFESYLKQLSEYLGEQGKSLKDIDGDVWQKLINGELSKAQQYKYAFVDSAQRKINNLRTILNENLHLLKINNKIPFKEPTTELKPSKDIIDIVATAPKESVIAMENIQKEGVAYVGKVTSGSPTSKISSPVAALIHQLHMMWGKRKVALTWSTSRASEFKKGKKEGQLPILIKDVERDIASDGKTEKLVLYLMDKGHAKKKKVEERFYKVIFYNDAEARKTFGYSPYEALDSILKQRVEVDKAGKNDPLLTYESSGKKPANWDPSIKSEHITNFAKRYYIGEAAAHKTRDLWLDIAQRIERDISKKVGYNQEIGGGDITNFVNRFFLDHVYKTSEIKRYQSTQPAEMTAFRHKALMELYELHLRDKLNYESFEKVINKYEVQWNNIEGESGLGKLWFNKDFPFRETLVKDTRRKSKAQQIGLNQHRVASSKELADQVSKEIKKNTGLTIEFMNSKDKGEFIDGVIRLAEGKADLTTFFHENVHRLEAFVRKSADKKLIKIWEKGERTVEQWAKKNDPDGWNKYVESYGEKAANEYLTQLSAEWSLEKAQATGMGGRLRGWFKQLVSRIKTLMGIHNPKDVARLFGKIAGEGFSTAGMVFDVSKKAKSAKGDLIEKDQIKELNKALKISGGKPKELLLAISKTLRLDGATSPEFLSISEYALVRDHLDTIRVELAADGSLKVKRKDSWVSLRKKVADINIRHGIKKDYETAIKKWLRIKDGSMRNASEEQMKRYLQFIEEQKENLRVFKPEKATDMDSINDEMVSNLNKKDTLWQKLVTQKTRFVFPVDYVMRKMGAKKLANRMLDHYFYEQRIKGEADFRIGNALGYIKKEYGARWDKNRKMMNDNMGFVLDPASREGMKLTPEAERFIRRAEKDANSGEYKAKQEIRKFTDFYYDTLIGIGKSTIKNPRTLERWLDVHNKKYVEDYFSRVLTKEARESFNNPETKGMAVVKVYNNLVNDIIKKKDNDISKLETQWRRKVRTNRETKAFRKKIRELEKERDNIVEAAAEKDGVLYNELMSDAATIIEGLIFRKTEVVTNKYLLDRAPRIDNLLKDVSTGKEFQVYETNFDKVMGRYVEIFSKYLATLRYFPSFTNLRSEYAESSYFVEKLDVMSKSGIEGAYVDKAFKKRIGLEQRDMSGDYWANLVTRAGNYSAVFGLSSPLSGLKNLVIGTTNTIGFYGTSNFLRSIALMFSPEGKQARELATRGGYKQTGTKEIELGGGWGDWWMRKMSFMKPTEAGNRFYSPYAGLYSAEQMIARLRGDSTSIFKTNNPTKITEYMKKMWDLTNNDIAFLQNFGLKKGDYGLAVDLRIDNSILNKRRTIRDKILNASHTKSQGATAEPFLPLWAQKRYMKGATLFYRMAYGATFNIGRHIVKPATKGNVLPMAQYLFAGNLFGSALWGILQSVIGTVPPKQNEELLSRIQMNLSKSETMGLLSFIFSPYGNKLSSDSIMQPAIARNTVNASMLAYNGIFGPMLEATGMNKMLGLPKFQEVDTIDELNKRLISIAPFAQHAQKLAIKLTNPYKVEMNRVKTFRRAFIKHSGFADQEMIHNQFQVKGSTNQAYYNLIRESFLNNDIESTARYVWATRLMLWDHYRELDGREYKNNKEATRLTNAAINNVIKHINPLHFSSAYRKAKIDKRAEFKKYLSEDAWARAVKAEKTYHFRKRQLNKEIDRIGREYKILWNEGYIIDMLPIPARFNFTKLLRFDTGEGWLKVRSKTSKVAVN